MNKYIQLDSKNVCENLKDKNLRFKGKKILLTGYAGFLGVQFLQYFLALNADILVNDKCHIVCLDNFKRGVPYWVENLSNDPNITLIDSDITLTDNFPENIDFVIHAASIASPTFYRIFPIETMDANVIGLRNLLDFYKNKNIESFLYFSTSEIYGDPDILNIPTKETYRGNVSCTGPRACYDESKRYGETLCVNFYKQYDFPVKIARPFNNYGPGLSINDKRVLPDFFSNILKGQDIVLFSDGNATRTFCYISDAITGYLLILLSNQDGEPFNVGSDKPEISMLSLAELLIKLTDSKSIIRFEKSSDLEYLSDNPQRRCPDLNKIKSILGFEPKVALEQGLINTYNYYKSEI
jgi:UDP-glucuronate decarboxylase